MGLQSERSLAKAGVNPEPLYLPCSAGANKGEVDRLRKENKRLREAAQDWEIKEKRLDLDKAQAELTISRLQERVRELEEGEEA